MVVDHTRQVERVVSLDRGCSALLRSTLAVVDHIALVAFKERLQREGFACIAPPLVLPVVKRDFRQMLYAQRRGFLAHGDVFASFAQVSCC